MFSSIRVKLGSMLFLILKKVVVMALYSFWIDWSGITSDLLRLFSFSEVMLDGYSCIWSLLASLECTNWILSWETGVCLHAFMSNDRDLCGSKIIIMQQTDIHIHYIPLYSLFQKCLVLIVPKYLLQHQALLLARMELRPHIQCTNWPSYCITCRNRKI